MGPFYFRCLAYVHKIYCIFKSDNVFFKYFNVLFCCPTSVTVLMNCPATRGCISDKRCQEITWAHKNVLCILGTYSVWSGQHAHLYSVLGQVRGSCFIPIYSQSAAETDDICLIIIFQYTSICSQELLTPIRSIKDSKSLSSGTSLFNS